MRDTIQLGHRLVNSYVKSMQSGSIDLNGETSKTATINTVDPANAILLYLGRGVGGSGNAQADLHNCRVELTNATTVTAYRGDSDSNSLPVKFSVLEFWPGVIHSIQRGTRLGNGTVTISPVNLTRAHAMSLGMSSTDSTELSLEAHIELTNATTLTITSGGLSTVGYQVVEWR